MNLKYKIEFSSQAEKFIKKLKNKHLLKSIISAIETLNSSPFAGKFLQGNLKGHHSYRLGNYRIIYKIIDQHSTILIEVISHRKDSYR